MSTPIPRPKGVPFLGNIFDLNPDNRSMYSGTESSSSRGQDSQKSLCDKKRFRKYIGGPIVEIRQAIHDALFTAFDHKESWAISHRIIAPKLSQQAVTQWFDEMRDIASELIEKWNGLGADNTISPMAELNRLNLEVTTMTLYGKRLNCLSGPEHPMFQAMEVATSEAMRRPTRPGILNWLVYGSKSKNANATMRRYGAELIDNRKAHPTTRQGVMAALFEGKYPETGKSLTDSQVIDEIVSMPIGSSTAPCLVSSAIYFLLKQLHIMALAREEIDTDVGSGEFKQEHLSQLKYLEASVRESLRLSFAAPGFNIEPIPSNDKRPIILAGGTYQVAHDQAMIVVLAGVNRDPAVFSEPLKFRPERMLGDAFDSLPPGVKK
ncbi:Cytochrome P450-like protein [Coniochaeta hoffmannii]|uniref:Cytochrome P450-like protein n=1 Tax=Coniochaeta hoffmannii TaxID=91930 RepID=A0AA38VPZ0_9PEZI|nr:Cytochrome P450-like protein [Coniochaeta hoffmannii]